MKLSRNVALLLASPIFSVHADLPSDAKMLANFDVNFERCEVKFPYMRGMGDQSYANLWHFELNNESRAYLASLRSSTDYALQQESRSEPATDPATWCKPMWAEAFPGVK